ncbi:MAG: vitamin K epoxide reductase family protein, partial [Planctomycetota bacterium]
MNPYRGDGADPQQPRLSTLRKLDHSHSTDRPHSPANRSASRFAAPGSLWFVWIALLMSIGASIAGYMAYVGLTGSRVAGCGGGIFSCDHVVTSRFSTVLWIPVGVPACMLYIVGLGFVLRAAATHADARHLCVRAIGWIGGLASASGLWFVGLQIFYLEHLCSYCMAAHGTAAILLASYCIRIRPTRTRVGVASFWCTSSAILLATVQLLTPPPPTFEIQTDPVVVDIPLPMGMEFDPASTAPATDPADVFGAPGQSDGGMFEAPASQDAAPLFDAPATTAPTFDAPTFDAPKVDASTLNAPTSDAAKRDASVVETTISETTSSAIAALQSVPGPEAKSDASNPNAAALKADPLNVGALDKSAAMLGALTESTSDDSP